MRGCLCERGCARTLLRASQGVDLEVGLGANVAEMEYWGLTVDLST